MFSKMTEPLTIYLDDDSPIREAVAQRAKTPSQTEIDADEEYEGPRPGDPIAIPSKLAICHSCEGRGKSSGYLGVFSGRRLEEAQEDEEWWDDYVSGRLDRACETCGGTGRLNVPDENRCSPELLKAIADDDEDEAAVAAEHRAERMMEGGWREEGWYD